jgi:surface polysaccharide O-acyltransferase-like enzyme
MTSTIEAIEPTRAAEPPPDAGGMPLSVDALVDATPAGRDRMVDLLRALSIGVVVLWHWVLSVTNVNDAGQLTMPNPIGDVPLLWLATWLLQVMPVFFFVGGFANLAALEAVERRGGGWVDFARSRLRRLLVPVGVFVGLWVVGDGAARLLGLDTTGVWHWGRVVFVPLWFLGIYTGVVLLAPLTARLHRSGRELTLIAMASAIALSDLGRFRFGIDELGLVNFALVFVFAHQLGYFWRDGTFTRWPRRSLWAMALAALVVLIVITNLGVYPHSMVAVRGEAVSNMYPTTACIAVLAVFQMAVAMLLRPAAERWLRRRAVWKAVVAANGVAMTVFTWHMTALVAVIGIWRLFGLELLDQPTSTWWSQRPIWLIGPALVLAVLVAIFARFERPRAGQKSAKSPGGRRQVPGAVMLEE